MKFVQLTLIGGKCYVNMANVVKINWIGNPVTCGDKRYSGYSELHTVNDIPVIVLETPDAIIAKL